MSIKHGLNETYSTQEAKNFHLGQSGYTILKTSGVSTIHPDENHYIAFMVLTDNVTVTASSLHDSSQDSIGPQQNFPKGVMIYGQWKRVSINKSAGTAGTISMILYKG